MTGTAVAKRTPMAEVCEAVASQEFGKKIKPLLPPSVTLDRFTRVTLTAIQQNPELITADRSSLFNAVIRCAEFGLIPDGREAALVIFKTKGQAKVQFMPMIGGLRHVLAKHGFTLTAHTVHENDTFDYQLGDEPYLKHKPPKLGKPRGEIIGAYALVKDKQGRMVIEPEVMGRDEIEQVRRVSRAADSEYGPWVNWYGEQCRKTVARRAYKQVPLGDLDERSVSLMQAADAEFDFEEPSGMAVEEANLTAALPTGAPPPRDKGPVDEHPPIDEGQEPQESFEDRAERAQRNRAAKAAES